MDPQYYIDEAWMAHAQRAAGASDDPDKEVGCVIVNPFMDTLVMDAANTMPGGITVRADRQTKPEKFDWIEHAERNAIFRAARAGIRTAGMTMYLPWFPCHECARAIIQARIAELVCMRPDFSHHKWGRSHEIATEMLDECDMITVRYFEESRDRQLLREAS